MISPNYTPGFWKWIAKTKYARTTKRRLVKKHWRKYQCSNLSNLLESHYYCVLSELVFEGMRILERVPFRNTERLGDLYRVPISLTSFGQNEDL